MENNSPVKIIPHISDFVLLMKKVEGQSPAEIALNFKSDHPVISSQLLAAQTDCYLIAHRKFPTLHQSGMLYTKKMLEQSSGEAILNFKKKLFEGKVAVDLTGGLGMDTRMLCETFHHVHSIEIDEEVFQLTRHNHHVAGIENCTHHQTSCENFLKNFNEQVDLVYVDPSRRDESRKVFLLTDSSPNVLQIISDVRQLTNRFVMKLSPMYDITQLLREIDQVADIYVISVRGEVKELLVQVLFDHPLDEPQNLHLVLSDKKGDEKFYQKFKLDDRNLELEITDVSTWLCEPDAAIIKAELTAKIGFDFKCTRIHPTVDYLTSTVKPKDFPGKMFEIKETLPFNPKKIKRYLSEKRISKVHIHKRDFHIEVNDLYKKFKLEMGEDANLFFTKNFDDKPIVIITEF